MMVNAIHPLKLWRLTQKVGDEKMSATYAAQAIGVAVSSWSVWENGQKVPSPEQMRKIYMLTRGQVRPDHFHDIAAWRQALCQSVSEADAA